VNPLHELDRQFQLPQLLLLLVFLAAYVSAIGRLLGPRGRWRAAALAALAAIGLSATVQPWTLGALLVAGGVAAVGAFALVTMLVCRGLEPARPPAVSPRRSAGRARAIPAYRSAG
jgi:hypothetical protein